MTTRRITFDLDIPEFIDSDDVQEWVSFHLGVQSTISETNPLYSHAFEGRATDVLAVDINRK